MGATKKADKDFGFNFSPKIGVAAGILSGLGDWIKQKKAAEVQDMQYQAQLQRALAPVMYQEEARTRRFETEQAGITQRWAAEQESLLSRWIMEQESEQQRWGQEHEVRMADLDLQLQQIETTLTLGREQMASEEGIARLREEMSNLRTQIQEMGRLQRTEVQEMGALTRTNIEQMGALTRTNIEQAGAMARTGIAERGETARAGTWEQKTAEYVRQDKETFGRLKFEQTFKLSQDDAKLLAQVERAADVYLGIALQRAAEPDNAELQQQYATALDEYENVRKQARERGLPVSTLSPPKFVPGRERKFWFDIKPKVEPRTQQPEGFDAYAGRFRARERKTLNDAEVQSLKDRGWSEDDIDALREAIK